MAMIAPVDNGKVVESASQQSLAKANAGGNGMDKESFLQLLVAQMQFQDPLEPTSNTEYIAQYAQFSQVEAISNMSSSMDLSRASSLVGQEVYIRTTSSSGVSDYIQGKVDYVVYENGKPYLSINESLYSLDDLDTVVDKTYLDAYNTAYDMTVALNKLPAVNNISIATDGSKIDEINEIYNSMDDYTKQFVSKETAERLNKYVEKLAELRAAAAKKAQEDNPDDGDVPDTGNTSKSNDGDEPDTGDAPKVEDDASGEE